MPADGVKYFNRQQKAIAPHHFTFYSIRFSSFRLPSRERAREIEQKKYWNGCSIVCDVIV